MTPTADLLDIAYLLEQLPENDPPPEVELVAKALHAEFVDRALFLKASDIKIASGLFQKLLSMRVLNTALPRLDQSVRNKIKETDPGSLGKKILFKGLPSGQVNPDDFMVSYDQKLERLVIRTKDCRVVFLGIKNRDASYKERVLDILGKERPSQIFLSLSPFGMAEEGQITYHSAEEIDSAMSNRFKGKSTFKVG